MRLRIRAGVVTLSFRLLNNAMERQSRPEERTGANLFLARTDFAKTLSFREITWANLFLERTDFTKRTLLSEVLLVGFLFCYRRQCCESPTKDLDGCEGADPCGQFWVGFDSAGFSGARLRASELEPAGSLSKPLAAALPLKARCCHNRHLTRAC